MGSEVSEQVRLEVLNGRLTLRTKTSTTFSCAERPSLLAMALDMVDVSCVVVLAHLHQHTSWHNHFISHAGIRHGKLDSQFGEHAVERRTRAAGDGKEHPLRAEAPRLDAAAAADTKAIAGGGGGVGHAGGIARFSGLL